MKILAVPDKLLHQNAKPVEAIDGKLQHLIDDMFITMYRAKGLGLAANQVGVLKQIVVMNVKYNPVTMLNPIIKEMGKEHISTNESCLSIPRYTASIERAEFIDVTYTDRYGFAREFRCKGLLARVIQHEVDHLLGRLINDV